MYAVVRTSKVADPAQIEATRGMLQDQVIPGLKQQDGTASGYLLGPVGDTTMSVIVYETKEAAESSRPQVGDSPAPGVTIESLEVREVFGSF